MGSAGNTAIAAGYKRRRLRPANTVEAAGCGGARPVGEAAEHEVVAVTSWFTETAKQAQAGKQDHREEKNEGGEWGRAGPTGEPLLPPKKPKANGSRCIAVNYFFVLRRLPQPDFRASGVCVSLASEESLTARSWKSSLP